MYRFRYPVTLTPDEADGGWVVTFADVPEAITQGDTLEECLEQAADCLEEAIAGRIEDGMDLPEPSEAAEGQRLVDLPMQPLRRRTLHGARGARRSVARQH